MSYRNCMESDEYGCDEYGPYETLPEAELGHFRLVVSAVATYRQDRLVREVYGDGGPAQVCGRSVADTHPEWTRAYQTRLYYEMPPDEVEAACRDYQKERDGAH